MKLIQNAVKGLIALLVFVSCENDTEVTVGKEVLPGSEVNFEIDPISGVINLEQVSTARVQTNNLPFYRLGNDGQFKYELVIKPIHAQANEIRSLEDTLLFARFKSANLILGYRYNEIARSTSTAVDALDTLKIVEGSLSGTSLNLNVKWFDQQINTINFGQASAATYYADGSSSVPSNNIDIKSAPFVNLATNSIVEFPELSTDFNPDANVEIPSTSLRQSKNIEDANGVLNIELNKAIFETYFVSEGSSILSQEELTALSVNAQFEEAFKAFYLEVIDGQNALAEVTANSQFVRPRLQMVFDIVNEQGEVQTQTVTVNDVVEEFTTFEVPFDFDVSSADLLDGQVINIVEVLSESEGNPDNTTVELVNGFNGSIASLKLFPNEERFEQIHSKKRIISEAVLRFTADAEVGEFDELPNRLSVNFSEGTPIAISDFANLSGSTGALFANHILEKKLVEAEDRIVYDVIITEHLQQIFNQEDFRGAIALNRDLVLSLYVDDEVPVYVRAKGIDNEKSFFYNRSLLFSGEKLSIFTSNAEEEASRPELIIKFTPIITN